ncbi:hypothetical protein [Hoeflea marina]|uniref:hypothetical protein n=1 Tax=Hoeflea marina TaxID=274592 RepID=UPI0013048CC0|nr:hypothetical protein [Hoeflea marina]
MKDMIAPQLVVLLPGGHRRKVRRNGTVELWEPAQNDAQRAASVSPVQLLAG